MIVNTAQQCSFLFSAYQSLVGGWLSSLGFLVNMLVIGGAYRAFMAYKQRNPDFNVKKAAMDFIGKHKGYDKV